MRNLLILTIVAGLGWAGYWIFASQGAKAGFEGWFEARQAEGWQAEYSDLVIRGFPNRIDTEFQDIALADPETGVAWMAPFFQILALSYKPNHVIAVWSNTHTLATPQQKLDIASQKMQASVVVQPDLHLPLDRSNFVTEGVTITSDKGWSIQADAIRAAIRKDESDFATYDIAYEGEGVAPPSALQNTVLPKTMSAMQLDMRVSFDEVWDLRSVSDQRPQPTEIKLRNATATWGDLSFRAAADVKLDLLGTPEGEATLRLQNWRQMLDLARESGQFNAVALDAAEQGLILLASLSGSRDDVDVTLRFAGGTTLVGIIPIGPAPRIRLR